MIVDIGAEAALFPEKEYINGIAVEVLEGYRRSPTSKQTHSPLCITLSRQAAIGQQNAPFQSLTITSSGIHRPWLGGTVNSVIGLSYRPAKLHRLAGRYDRPMPELTLSPSQGSTNSATQIYSTWRRQRTVRVSPKVYMTGIWTIYNSLGQNLSSTPAHVEQFLM